MENTTNYASRPLWHWIIAYAIIAVIVYGLVYYIIALKKNGNAPVPANQSPAQTLQGTVIGANNLPVNSVVVTISKNGFSPKSVTIKKGQTVVWKNEDASSAHTVTSDNNNGPMSPELKKNSTYRDTFMEAGTYHYHCKLHPEMKGTVTVTE